MTASPNLHTFYSLDALDHKEVVPENVRIFQGEGTPFLKVPGLRAVHAVRVETRTIPLSEKRVMLVNAHTGETETVEEPLIIVQRAGTEHAVLLRSRLSNNGIWQAHEDIAVAGEWAEGFEAPEPKPVEKKTAKKGLK